MADEFSLEEALAAGETDILEINSDLRTINVPSGYIFGVFNDKDVLPVLFKMNKTYDTLDMSTFQIRINFQNAAGTTASYIVTDKKVEGNTIYFSWLLGREVFVGEGTVKFVVCLRKFNTDGTVDKEFNTTIARSTVLNGLEADDPESDPYRIIGQIDSIEILLQCQEIQADIDTKATTIDELYEKIKLAEINYGAPFTAATASEMTNRSRVYVYTGSESGYNNGHWYYHNGTAWTDGGTYQSTGVNTDKTLTVPDMAADAKTVGDKLTAETTARETAVAELKNDLNELGSSVSDEFITIYSKNRFDIKNVEAGYVNQVTGAWVSGGTTYEGTPNMIEVLGVPFMVTIYKYAGATNLVFRYAVYDENGDYLTGAIVPGENLTFADDPTDSHQKCGYLVFNDSRIKYIRFSMVAGYFSTLRIKIEQGDALTAYTPCTNDVKTADGLQILNRSVIGEKGFGYYNSYVQKNATIKIGIENSLKKNKVYHLHTLIDSTFTHLLFGHGEGAYSLYFDIDTTNITFMTNGTAGTVLTHGLTLDTYIDFMLVVGDGKTGTIILNTLGGTYTKTVQIVQGYKGDVFLRPVECKLGETYMTFTSADFRQPIWMFGDSYFTHTSTARWPYWLLEWGFGRCLLNGFPGANSDEALPQVVNYLGIWGIPKHIVWCLGMNDPDNGAINQTWLDCVTELIAQCKTYGVEPILATIPNVPNLDHTYKNAWVRSSGYRYVDFAKAVGAESADSSWYTGALSSDNTHPSEIGARLLCQQALLDVPELTLGNI